jgi:hypothetical protein
VFPSFQETIPEGRYVLVFWDARVLPCWPGEPPLGAIGLALTASLANAQKFFLYDPRIGIPLVGDHAQAEQFA